ncbi:MAG: AAA family ATPase [Chloroflexota bacterium]
MTLCRSCGRDNKAGRKFCAFCGAAMAVGCPSCGTPYEPGELFCGECGASLPGGGGVAAVPSAPVPAAAPTIVGFGAAPVAERRLVSIVFADLVGFTPFAAARDSEDVRETLSRYFDLASDVIGRYGGTVEKFIGDAVMAVWGTPRAHEDDAERAVRAALDLVDAVRALGPGIQARAGVLTGEAAVTIGATNQGMVAGDLVNTAARLQSVAQPGTVLAGEATMRAAGKAIAFEPEGPQQLKGKESPVPAFRALRVVAEVGGRNRQEGLEAPFVGRDDEMRQLKDLFHATARDRRVRLISVLGPAGIGKSRFAWEFLKYIDGLAGTVWWHQGRSPAYGSGLSFWALGEMIRARCGLLEGADERTTRARVAATVAENVPDEGERRWIEPALLTLLGVGDRGASAEQLFAAWRTFFERLAASAPVVMLFEDLQWADAGTLGFIDHLLDWTRDLPIVLITLARPELLELRPDWGAQTRHYTKLFLEPLTEAAMRELLAGLVPGLPERAIRSITARADGIPLYAVETVRMLLADGQVRAGPNGYEPVGDLSELAVPETLTALIAARLDALDPADRSLLQDAAVLGQSFTPAALAALAEQPVASVEPRLRALVRRELLVLEADPRSPERGQYAFVQALIREVAYNTLSKRDRKAKHLAAARWFESLGSDELAGALARHYLAAWQATPEGPEADALAAQARLALKGAAERAAALYAHRQAVDLLTEALTVTPDPVDRGVLLERAAQSAHEMGDYDTTIALAQEAIALAQKRGDGLAEARATTLVSRGLVTSWRWEENQALLEEAIPRLAALAPHPDILFLQLRGASIHIYREEPRPAMAVLDGILEPAERGGHRRLTLEGLILRASTSCDLGRLLEGRLLLDACAREAEAQGWLDLVVLARGDLAVYLNGDDPRTAVSQIRALLELARRLSRRRAIVVNTLNAAENAIRVGEWDWAEAALAAELREDLAAGERVMLLDPALQLRALRGQDHGSLLQEAEDLSADKPAFLDQLLDRRAVVAWVEGRYAEASASWRRFAATSSLNAPVALPKSARARLWDRDVAGAKEDLAAIDALGARGRATDASRLTISAGIAAFDGDAAEARRLYREARAAYVDLGVIWDEALMCLDQALLLGPDDPDTAEAAERAREIFTQLGAAPFLAKLDEALDQARPARSSSIR